MIRRSTRILLEVMVGILAGVVLLSGVTVWRLSQKPLNVDFLTPYIELALTGGESGFKAEVGKTVLAWNELTRTIDLQAREVRLSDSEGFTIATLPQVAVNLKLRALVQGVVAPTKIDIIGARVTLIRSREGGFDFGQPSQEEKGEQDAEDADFSMIVPGLLAELLSEPDPARPLSFLQEARFLDGKLTIYDRKQRAFWHAPSAEVSVERTPGGLSGNMDLTIALGAEQADLGLTLLYREADASTIIAARIDELAVEALAALDESLALLAGFDFPVSGGVSAVLEADGVFKSLDIDLTGGPGRLSLPAYLPEPLQVQELAFRGFLDGAAQSLEIETAELLFAANPELSDAPGPRLTASGKLSVREGDVEIEVAGKAMDVPAADLGHYWPPDLAPGAREWVTANIRSGLAEEAEINALVRMPAGELAAIEVESLTGGYRYRDLEVHYLAPMPPVTAVSGSARFDRDRMTFDLTNGKLGELSVPEAAIEIEFDEEDDIIKIDLTAAGPLQRALELLDHERLQLVSKLGIKPADSAGEAIAQVGFEFPLVQDLTFDRMKIGVKAKLAQVAVKQVIFGRDAFHGELALDLDNDGMMVSGPLELAELPVDLQWRENFKEEGGPVSVFNIRVARLNERDLAGFGLDLRPYLKGPVSATLVVTRNEDKTSSLATTLNLRNADLSLPFLEWQKQPEDKGEMRLDITLEGERAVALNHLEVNTGSLFVTGRGGFDETGTTVTRLDLDQLHFGRSRLSGVTVLLEETGTHVELGEGVLDAAPFVDSQREPASSDTTEADEGPAFSVSARRLGALTFGEDRYLEKVTLKLDRRTRGWQEITLRATIPKSLWTEARTDAEDNQGHRKPASVLSEGADDQTAQPAPQPKPEEEAPKLPRKRVVRMRYGPGAESGYDLKVTSNDMGALMRALDLRDTVRGGQLEIVGHSDGPIPKHTLSAHIEAEDYVLVNATTLTKILTAGSLTGLMDTLRGNGIWFDRLTGDFTLTDGLLHTELLHAYGSALGVTTKGDVDFDSSEIDLEGTVVPAYTVNRVLGKIPGLGFILTGGEGGGLLAITYDVDGQLGDPDVSVNPLSVLAPGFLRGLFGGINGENVTVFPDGPNR